MTNQEILTKAIEKAIAGGWDILARSESDGFIVRKDAYYNLFVSFSSKPENDSAFAQSYMEIIFNHDFAKALWGEGHYNLIVGEGRKAFGSKDLLESVTGEKVLEAWQYHLQMMVISEDPIKYLGENI